MAALGWEVADLGLKKGISAPCWPQPCGNCIEHEYWLTYAYMLRTTYKY
jgi:hypothetical protein